MCENVTKFVAGANLRAAPGLPSEADQIAGLTRTQPKCQVQT